MNELQHFDKPALWWETVGKISMSAENTDTAVWQWTVVLHQLCSNDHNNNLEDRTCAYVSAENKYERPEISSIHCEHLRASRMTVCCVCGKGINHLAQTVSCHCAVCSTYNPPCISKMHGNQLLLIRVEGIAWSKVMVTAVEIRLSTSVKRY